MTPLARAFAEQAESCGRLGSPFMARLCGLLSGQMPAGPALTEVCAGFSGDLGPAAASLPLRIAGGLHALVLSGRDPALAAAYPPANVSDATLTAALAGAMAAHDRFLASWIASPPQTNEIRRSAALIAGAAVAASRFALPVVLSELGASGGLNLWWDRYALALPGRTDGPDRPVVVLAPDWHGPLPPSTRPHVAQRRGVDLMPLDPGDPADALRLAAFLWPDQPQRLEMTRRAAALGSPGIDRADALDWLERRLHSAPQGHLHLVQNTVVWQYLPAPAQARGAAMMAAAGARATAARPLAWLQMESDGNAHGAGGAALTLRLWPGDVTLSLGRADFHGRWIDWTADLSQT
ncbi:MAG: DUF2332 family protein [Roseivivax sp.]|nr:DUF2332 family protein [Roseivivax sp.]